MSDPTMDQIERGLREMTEPPSQHTGEPTELWKRALEISRAEERAGLVHPGADRAERPRGRRLLIALNAVGVAAMIVLAAGVWTVMRVAPETEKAGVMSDEIASAKAEASEQGLSIFADKAALEESVEAHFSVKANAMADQISDESVPSYLPTPYAPTNQQEETPKFTSSRSLVLADQSEEEDSLSGLQTKSSARRAASAGRQITLDPTAAVDDSHPGISQMMNGFERGLVLEGGDASVMAFGPTLENAEIVIEVASVTEAFNAVSELPSAEFEEYSVIDPPKPEEADADENEKVEARMPDSLVLNMSPARLNQALDEIRGLGHVVEERIELDSPSRRAEAAIDWALVNTSPNFKRLETVIEAQGLTEHERAHRNLPLDDAEQLEAVREAIGEVVRRLEDTRRSMNLSRIRVTIRQAPESDTIEE